MLSPAMPKPYKRKNLYCRNTKLSEAEFEQVVTGFLAGMGAAAVSRDMDRSEKTVRTMFARLRERLANDSELMGWMGGGDLPDGDDPVWVALYDCLLDCPALIEDRTYSSPEFVKNFRGYDPDADQTQRSLSFTVKKHGSQCTSCPILLAFDLDISARGHLGYQELRAGGIPRSNFKPHFFEAMFRANLESKNKKFDARPEDFIADRLLAVFAERPL